VCGAGRVQRAADDARDAVGAVGGVPGRAPAGARAAPHRERGALRGVHDAAQPAAARLERVERERVVRAVAGRQQQWQQRQRVLRLGVRRERVRERGERGERGVEEEADPDRDVFAVAALHRFAFM
jgi:hypothetical protein